ncbi:L-aspartate oxidase [Oligoflexaceae bacterium]|nr:L-aspartate oxidase [Oligoflexaceae bacterium]
MRCVLTSKQVENLIIGSGISGLSLALKLAESEPVLLVTKEQLFSGASTWAQGGVATVFSDSDSFESHANDTLRAGAGICHPEIVRMVVEKGPSLVSELIQMGVDFSKASGRLHLTKEGGHSERRVVHSEDQTGAAIMNVLVEKVKAHPQIQLMEDCFAVDLLTSDKWAPEFGRNRCLGAYVFDRKSQTVVDINAEKTYLCTGGHGRLYLYTSNPRSATGDGLAMAWRAGCKIANLEFMQFHPTCLFHPHAKTFLITEALRGEGAKLITTDGRDFMKDHHELGSLAPRDIVARSISLELDRSGEQYVCLDATHIDPKLVQSQFPHIQAHCLEIGIDITRDPIPVTPAAHYSCGGVVTDANARTNVEGLYAIGEVACTGLHGANRLASNSILETLVFADLAAKDGLKGEWSSGASDVDLPGWHGHDVLPVDELGILACNWDEIRRLMWHYVGIIRSSARLDRAFDRIQRIRQEIEHYYWKYEVSEQLLEVRNLCHVALLTIQCARARKESRGIHFMIEYPKETPLPQGIIKDTVIW